MNLIINWKVINAYRFLLSYCPYMQGPNCALLSSLQTQSENLLNILKFIIYYKFDISYMIYFKQTPNTRQNLYICCEYN